MITNKNQKNNDIDFEKVSLAIITYAGTAKSLVITAISIAKAGDYQTALKMVAEANENLTKASGIHMDIIAKESQGLQLPFSLLFMHAEMQLLTTEMMIEISKEFINLYQYLKISENINN